MKFDDEKSKAELKKDKKILTMILREIKKVPVDKIEEATEDNTPEAIREHLDGKDYLFHIKDYSVLITYKYSYTDLVVYKKNTIYFENTGGKHGLSEALNRFAGDLDYRILAYEDKKDNDNLDDLLHDLTDQYDTGKKIKNNYEYLDRMPSYQIECGLFILTEGEYCKRFVCNSDISEEEKEYLKSLFESLSPQKKRQVIKNLQEKYIFYKKNLCDMEAALVKGTIAAIRNNDKTFPLYLRYEGEIFDTES